jgi:hypothetical protein
MGNSQNNIAYPALDPNDLLETIRRFETLQTEEEEKGNALGPGRMTMKLT